MADRVTQLGANIVRDADARQARVTQLGIHVIADVTARQARATQVGVHVIMDAPDGSFTADAVIAAPPTRLYQLPVEVVAQGDSQARLYQEPVEVVVKGDSEARLYQMAVEVIVAPLPTIEGDFTADAVIAETVSNAVPADAVLRASLTSDLTADAVLLASSGELTFTADAYIPGPTVYRDFTADAVLGVTWGPWSETWGNHSSQTFTADASFALHITETFDADAVLLATQPGSATADALRRETFSDSATADALLLATLEDSLSIDATIWATVQKSFSADADIWETGTVFGSVDADAVVLANSGELTFTADAALVIHVEADFTAGAVKKQTVFSATYELIYEDTFTRVVGSGLGGDWVHATGETGYTSVDGSVGITAAQHYEWFNNSVIDALVAGSPNLVFQLDFWVPAAADQADPPGWSMYYYADLYRTWFDIYPTEPVATSSPIEVEVEVGYRPSTDSPYAYTTINLDESSWYTAKVEQFGGGLANGGGRVKIWKRGTAEPVEWTVVKTDARPITESPWEMWLGLYASETDAAKIDNYQVWVPDGKPSIDAVIQTNSGELTFTADAEFIERRFWANAVVQRAISDDFTAESWIVRRTTDSVDVDAVIFRQQSGSATVDAIIVSGLFWANADIWAPRATIFQARAAIGANSGELTFTADADLTGRVFTIDAALATSESGTFTADAVIASGTFTADAAISVVESHDFTVDAVIASGFFLADASIVAAPENTFTIDATIGLSTSLAISWAITDAVTSDLVAAWEIGDTGASLPISWSIDTTIDADLPASWAIDAPVAPDPDILTTSIKINGVDITEDVDILKSSWEMAAGPTPGTAKIYVLDRGQTMSFVVGQRMTLDIGELRVWGGYIMGVHRQYAFPAQDTSEPGLVPRYWVLDGSDYNILFSKRYVYNKANPTDGIPAYKAGVRDDDVIDDLVNDYLNMSDEVLNKNRVHHVGTPVEDDDGSPLVPGISFGDAMKNIALMPGAIFYFDADRILNYADVDIVDAPFKLSDQPDNVEFFGYRDLELLEDGTNLGNDALVWGAALGVDTMTFARHKDDASIEEHGRWQWADFRKDLYRQQSVLKRATTYVDGSTQNNRGHKDDAITIRCTVFKPGLRAGMKVRFKSIVHGYNDVIPIRSMRISFVNRNEAKYELTLAHYLDEAWNTAEFKNRPDNDDEECSRIRVCDEFPATSVADDLATSTPYEEGSLTAFDSNGDPVEVEEIDPSTGEFALVSAEPFDNFNRTTGGGLGTSSDGHVWYEWNAPAGTSSYVDGAHARFDWGAWTNPGDVAYRTGNYVAGPWNTGPWTMTMRVKWTRMATVGYGDGSPSAFVRLRLLGGDDTSSSPGVMLSWTSNATYSPLLLVSEDMVSGPYQSTYASVSANTYYNLKCQYTGSVIRAKVWPSGSSEPSSWAVSDVIPGGFSVANKLLELTVDYKDNPYGGPVERDVYIDYISFGETAAEGEITACYIVCDDGTRGGGRQCDQTGQGCTDEVCGITDDFSAVVARTECYSNVDYGDGGTGWRDIPERLSSSGDLWRYCYIYADKSWSETPPAYGWYEQVDGIARSHIDPMPTEGYIEIYDDLWFGTPSGPPYSMEIRFQIVAADRASSGTSAFEFGIVGNGAAFAMFEYITGLYSGTYTGAPQSYIQLRHRNPSYPYGLGVVSKIAFTFDTSKVYRLKMELTPASALQAKVWEDGTTEPTSWTITADISDRPSWVPDGIFTFLFGPQYPDEDSGATEWWYDDLNVEGINRCTAANFDDFNRTVASGWGTASSGATWTPYYYPVRFSVDGSSGLMEFDIASGNSPYIAADVSSVTTASAWDVTVRLKVEGGGYGGDLASSGLGFRLRISDGSYYSGGESWSDFIDIAMFGDPSSELDIASANTSDINLGPYSPSAWYRVRWTRISEGGSYHHKAKIWLEGSSEPDWQIDDDWGTVELAAPLEFGVDDRANPNYSNATLYIDSISFTYDGMPCYPGASPNSSSIEGGYVAGTLTATASDGTELQVTEDDPAAGTYTVQSYDCGTTTYGSTTVIDSAARPDTSMGVDNWGYSDHGELWHFDSPGFASYWVENNELHIKSGLINPYPATAEYWGHGQSYQKLGNYGAFTYPWSEETYAVSFTFRIVERHDIYEWYVSDRYNQYYGQYVYIRGIDADRAVGVYWGEGGTNGARFGIYQFGGSNIINVDTFAIGQDYRCRFVNDGSIVRAKYWLASQPEPATWTVTAPLVGGTFTADRFETMHVMGNPFWIYNWPYIHLTLDDIGISSVSTTVPDNCTATVCYTTTGAVYQGGKFYRPAHVRQLGWGTSFDGLNCTMASACIALDRHTLGAKTATPPQMRAAQLDQSGGTDLGDADYAWNHGWNENLNVQYGLSWSSFVSMVNNGRGAIVQGVYGELSSAYKAQQSFNGGHAVYVNEFSDTGNAFVYDPLASGPRWWPASELSAYALAWGNGTVSAGFTQITT